MAVTQTSVFLGVFETKALLDLETRAPGVYRVKMMVRANSLLSSVFIKSADVGATVEVKYFDTTTGDENSPERFDLDGHGVLGAVGTNRILVTEIHNKPQLEVLVAGGNVEFGVYVTAVATSASAIDQSLVKHLSDTDLAVDKGLTVTGYDPVLDKFFFLPIESGAVKVTGNLSTTPGGATAALNTTVTTSATPNTETSFTLATIKSFRVTNRGRAIVKYAFASGDSGLNYASLTPNASFWEEGIFNSSVTLYIQSPSPSQRLEVVSWT